MSLFRSCGLKKMSLSSCRRLQHSSQQRSSTQQVHPDWLRRVLEDRDRPSRLYAWTTENIDVNASGAGHITRKEAAISKEHQKRIYVLGVGNIGRLYAMCLAKHIDRPPITLVVHRKELLEHWAARPGIELTRYGQIQRNANFDIEWWTDAKPATGPIEEPALGGKISNLIVATKASDAIPQVDRLRGYLSSSSTVAFTQNGMCKLWPPLGETYVNARFEKGASPSWLACVTTHGVTSEGAFRSTHAAPATALVGPVIPNNSGNGCMEYLMERIASAPDLAARQVSKKELWVSQLEKLVVNAIINPLTAVLRCKNGELFIQRDDCLPEIIDRLLGEASEALQALIMDPTSDAILVETANGQSLEAEREKLKDRFSFDRLRNMIYDVGAKVAENTSSMLQDVRAGKQTEINDFNGWLIETERFIDGELQLLTHERLVSLVQTQAALSRADIGRELLR
ncbi:6-phosphogluconate dehydrogenase C-terminal domain-like protein [Xylariaceae sp. FL0016]|nr:6-phosphogluconate dehydrogenase C-terminal domain-like protein [Xylariaceae sp. FL0016]